MLDLLVNHSSYLGIIVVLILTGSGLPIPEEVPIITAGVASSLGSLNPWAAFASCLVGAIAGDCVMYAIGYHFGHNLIKEHPRFAHLLHAELETRIEQKIRQHGLKIFFLSRFMVGIRAPVYLAAGVLRIPFRRFLLIDLFCAASVVGLFFGLSYAYGEQIARALARGEKWLTIVVVLVVAIVLGIFWLKGRRLAGLTEPDTSDGEQSAGGDNGLKVDNSGDGSARSPANGSQESVGGKKTDGPPPRRDR